MAKVKKVKPGPASKKQVKKSYPLTRSDEILTEVLGTFLDSQSKAKDHLTDVHLICKDGIIPAHAIILTAASEFFAAALKSQGDNYASVRIILLPDYCVKEIRDVVQVIYSGKARFSENDDAQSTEANLKALGVDNVKYSKSKVKTPEDEDAKLVRCYLTKRINHRTNGTETNLSELKPLFGSQVEEGKKNNPSSSNSKNLRKRQVETKNSSGVSSSDSDSDYSPGSDRRRKSKRKTTSNNMSPRVAMERLDTSSSIVKPSSYVNVQVRTSNVPVKKSTFYTYNGNQYKNNEEEIEPDSDEWEEPDYNNKAWFETEARRCQKCQKQHANPAAASTCITSHQRLRCYFCFAIAKNTEKLFEHFTKKHKQAGRENCLMCPYCEQTVPFKSVSCHVISIHLSENRGLGRINSNAGPGRPSVNSTVTPAVNNQTANTATTSSAPPKENVKRGADSLIVLNESAMTSDDGLLRVGNLDVTIRNKLGNGKTMVYHLQKTRTTSTDT